MAVRYRFLLIAVLGVALTALTARLTGANEPAALPASGVPKVVPPGADPADAHGATASHTPRNADGKPKTIFQEFWYNLTHNLFKPLLLFFYMGFLVPIFKVELDFPHAVYQALTLYLLIAIGWHGGEQLSRISVASLGGVLGFMVTGFVLNFVIGILAFLALHYFTDLREVDKATVAGYYGSDSAGTFATCVGVLGSTVPVLVYDPYMPVMLAVMEIPGCLVALYLVNQLRARGLDANGNMPHEPGYSPAAVRAGASTAPQGIDPVAEKLTMEENYHKEHGTPTNRPKGVLNAKLLHEVFLNPGLYLLFGGILVGYISGYQGEKVTDPVDPFLEKLFQGVLCLFLLEMGMTASRKMRDLRSAGWPFIAFGLIAPNVFATLGMCVAHGYCMVTGFHLAVGSYVLFAVLCGAASYIAVPAVQRLAIPEASPSLPLAASLGLTFSYNVTIGIPIYIEISKFLMRQFPA